MYQTTRGFQQKIVTESLTYVVALLIAVSFWFVSYSLGHEESYEFTFLGWSMKMPALWAYLLGFVLHWGISLLLIQGNNVFSVIRVRTTIHSSLYLLLVACMPALHYLSVELVAFALTCISLHLLFQRFQDEFSQGMAFHQYALVGIASLFYVKELFLVPLFWLGAGLFRASTLRSFIASLLGLLLPYWFVAGYLSLTNQMNLLYDPFVSLFTWSGFSWEFTPWPAYSILLLLLLFVVSAIHTLINKYEDKIQTRAYLHYIIFAGDVLFIILCIWPTSCTGFLPFCCISVGYIYGHFLAVTNDRFSHFFLILSFIAMLILSILNLWMLF